MSAASAAIEFALDDDDGIEFLRYWNEGEFDILRRNWPNAPEAVYIGADPLHPETKSMLASELKAESTSLGLQGATGIPGHYADHLTPSPALYRRTANPVTDMEKLVNAVLVEAEARNAFVAPILDENTITLGSLTTLVKLMCARPKPEPLPPPLPDYRFVYNDWREDRCSLYGPTGCIVSGLAPYQTTSLKLHFQTEANHMRQRAFNLRRYAINEIKEGVYEHSSGSYVLFKDVRDLFEVPIMVEMK